MADQPSTSAEPSAQSLRNILEIEKQVRNKARFSAGDVVHFVMLHRQDSDCDLSDGDDEGNVQIDKDSMMAEFSNNNDRLDEDEEVPLDEVNDEPPPAIKGKENSTKRHFRWRQKEPLVSPIKFRGESFPLPREP